MLFILGCYCNMHGVLLAHKTSSWPHSQPIQKHRRSTSKTASHGVPTARIKIARSTAHIQDRAASASAPVWTWAYASSDRVRLRRLAQCPQICQVKRRVCRPSLLICRRSSRLFLRCPLVNHRSAQAFQLCQLVSLHSHPAYPPSQPPCLRRHLQSRQSHQASPR